MRRALRPPLAIAAFAAALLGGCKDEGGEDDRPLAGAGGARSGEAIVPGTEHIVAADDPLADGWESEAVGAHVSKALKALGKAMQQRKLDAAVEKVVAPDFTVAALRPPGRTLAVETGAISVLEPTGELLGGADLASELRAMLAEAGFAEPPERVATKVISVVVFQMGGVGAEGERRQLGGRWQSEWRVGDGAATLRSLRGAGVVMVSKVGGFRDVTHAALGGARDFADQFYRGQDHWVARVEALTGLDVGGWQGLAVADVNGDGREDLYVAQPGGLPNRLFVAAADGTFSERAAESGIDFLDSSHANLFADLDNDGDPDLVAGLSYGVLVMENDGGGRFTPRKAKLMPASIPYSVAAADYDLDGDLDFYVCGYNIRPGVTRHHDFVRPVPYHDAKNGGRNAMFRNDGGWRFAEATGALGMGGDNRRFSYACAWEDYDLDGDPDLYVANDFGRNNLFRNDRESGRPARFVDVADEAGAADIGPGMSACWGDYDDDGLPDLYVANMFSSAGHRVTGQGQFQRGADDATLGAFRRHARGNTLLANRGGGRFEDVGVAAGVTLGRWAWGSKFADLDSDGRLDIVVANGFITQRSPDDL